jgi:hypothetical protein
MTRKKKAAPLDLSYAQAMPVMPFQARRIRLSLVGLGGTFH